MGLFKRQKRRVEGDVREKKQIKREDQRNRSGLPLDDPKLKPLHDKKRNWEDGKTNEARNERGSMTEGDVYNQMLESIEQYPDEQNYAFLFSNVTPEQGEIDCAGSGTCGAGCRWSCHRKRGGAEGSRKRLDEA